MPVSMNGEEKRYLILELSQEKEQHRGTLEQLKEANLRVLFVHDAMEFLSHNFA